VKREDAERYAEILRIVQHVENKKQIHLSPEERESLAISLNDMPETLTQIIDRAEILIRSKDYSRIPFDAWLNTQRLFTEAEVTKIVHDEIEALRKRIQEAKTKAFDGTVIDAELLESEMHIYASRLDAIRDRRHEAMKARLKKAERFIKTAPMEIKEELLKHLTEKKLLTDAEPHWDKIIHFFTPHILIEAETIMRRLINDTK
jgi:hypothetical protein